MAAMICTDCPETSQLRKLIDGSLPDDEQSVVTAHLDCCETCQKSIEQIAAGGSGLLNCACRPDTVRPQHTSAYWPALRQLERDVVKVAHASMEITRSEHEASTVPDDVPLDFLDPAEQPGTLGKLGRFHVVEVVGRGGMGIVLRALDVCLQRQVALKVLDPQYLKNDLARNRFIREARSAASITHENVVSVHHVERHRDEIPYLVMQLVNGESLQDRLDGAKGPLPLADILEIGRQTAAGLAAAHEQTLIHRDIKPANILLEAGTGRVLLTDFGLARAAEDAKLTQTGFVAGTPLYMSPEQARGQQVDYRTDLFSFGSVLYAMCTGTPPFQGSSPFVVLQAVTEARHRSVREVNPAIPEDLATIIDHLLQKKPENRFQSASEVAGLLNQLHVKVTAAANNGVAPKSSLRSLPRLRSTRRQRILGWAAIAVLTLNGLLLITEATKLTKWTVLGQRGLAGDGRQEKPELAEEPEPKLVLDAGTGPIWAVSFSPDGKTIAVGIDDGSVRLWNAKTGELKSRIPAHKLPVWSIAYSHDGTMLATASEDATVRIWDTDTSREIDTIECPAAVRSVVFSPDDTKIGIGTRKGHVRVIDWKMPHKNPVITTGHSDGIVMAVAFSSDGKLLASGGGDQTVKVWNVSNEDGKEIVTLSGHLGGVYSVAFHPIKREVASGSWDRTIRIWNINTGRTIRKLEGHKEDVWSIAFCSEGKILASGSEDRTAKIWDVEEGKELLTLSGHVGTIYGIAISPVSRTIATAGRDGTVKIWEEK